MNTIAAANYVKIGARSLFVLPEFSILFFPTKELGDNHESISLLLSVDIKILIVQQINDV